MDNFGAVFCILGTPLVKINYWFVVPKARYNLCENTPCCFTDSWCRRCIPWQRYKNIS